VPPACRKQSVGSRRGQARAKGLFETLEQPGRLAVFQFAGGWATLAPGGRGATGILRTRIVFIADIGVLSNAEISRIIEACTEAGGAVSQADGPLCAIRSTNVTSEALKFPVPVRNFPVPRNIFPVNFHRKFHGKTLQRSRFLLRNLVSEPQNREIPC
jgi:hypothetical protein